MTGKKATKNLGLTDAELHQMADFEASFDDTAMMELEKDATSSDIGLRRRIALAVLTRSADQLSEVAVSDPDTYAAMIESAQEFEQHAEGLLQIARDASIRLRVADCRELAAPAR